MGDPFTIQISSKLINQLAQEADKPKKKTKKPKPNVQKKPQQPQTNVQPKTDGFETHQGAPAAVWPHQSPLFMPVAPSPAQVANAELDAIRSILQESEKVVERLQKQEDNMVQEVTQRAKELHDKEFKLPYQKPMPCLAEKDACLECYKEYAKDPLKCANVVKSYADCTRKIRQ
ncbi:hypothetical protein AQUCO_01300655v1 [Aquilegia coerulea]|uniref:Uncharacterized protein n=1 Tax=Aquilegia coerulea TaxID=218851 RepID=A0A2G5E2U0_AQUCA|nr:hypothetical protein AQUCO_01300655v1 [Aquilegia coerulea]